MSTGFVIVGPAGKFFAVIAALWFPLQFVSPATVVKTYTLRITHIFKQIPLHWVMQAAIQ